MQQKNVRKKNQPFNVLTWEGFYGEEAHCYYNITKCQIEAFQVMPLVILHWYINVIIHPFAKNKDAHFKQYQLVLFFFNNMF